MSDHRAPRLISEDGPERIIQVNKALTQAQYDSLVCDVYPKVHDFKVGYLTRHAVFYKENSQPDTRTVQETGRDETVLQNGMMSGMDEGVFANVEFVIDNKARGAGMIARTLGRFRNKVVQPSYNMKINIWGSGNFLED